MSHQLVRLITQSENLVGVNEQFLMLITSYDCHSLKCMNSFGRTDFSVAEIQH